ncbi:adenylyl-sulfate kinase [Pedobacter roseus]|uniref:Adenylyl-sulfate kinase n=1 Tax=Pedobacter roseus TaxID=336820 RepID=A0A7G9QKU2_9SPHI|nr:adenylyl-sulfate kinase [Pedobacter roseus]QNN43967.1 adenylyl-sulfate kinase [Pedobacter roseus]
MKEKINLFIQDSGITREQRENRNGANAFTIWMTGLSGAGKSTLSISLERWLFNNSYNCYRLDGDSIRQGMNRDLGFSKVDRAENIRRAAEVCKLFNDSGIIVIASFISPFSEDRSIAENIIGKRWFHLVYINASIEVCKKRDVKGLYKLSSEGKLKDFTGIDSLFEIPESTSLTLNTEILSETASLNILIQFVQTIITGKKP